MAETVATVVTYLEMRSPPAGAPAPPPHGARVVRLESPDRARYLALYDGVGRDLLWTERKLMPAAELTAILRDPGVEVYALQVDGADAGYAELDRRVPGEVQLAYFGLFPAFVGRGLGRYLLSWALRRAFDDGPGRVWVHTCDLDHPNALPTYRKAGFVPYDQRVEHVALLGDAPA